MKGPNPSCSVVIWSEKPSRPGTRKLILVMDYEAQIAQVDSQIRRTSETVTRYLLAFEAGTLAEAICADRVRDLNKRLTALQRSGCKSHLVKVIGRGHPTNAVDLRTSPVDPSTQAMQAW